MTVLIVDDNKELADAISFELKLLGISAISAQAAKQGLALIEISKIDIVIADIQMPEMDGLRFVDEVHKRNPKTRVFLMTGNMAMASATLSRKGIECVFEKPFDIFELIEKIGRRPE